MDDYDDDDDDDRLFVENSRAHMENVKFVEWKFSARINEQHLMCISKRCMSIEKVLMNQIHFDVPRPSLSDRAHACCLWIV